jgi:hypothetical protein
MRMPLVFQSLCSGSPARVPRQSRSDVLYLDARESLELILFHRHLLTKANLPSRSLDERHTIGVQGLVDRRSTRLGLRNWDTSLSRCFFDGPSSTGANVFYNSSLHGELDPVERDEPDDIL